MTRHDDATRLRHMLDYSRMAVRLAVGRSRDDLGTDELFGLGMTRVVEVIGEAAARVGRDSRSTSAISVAVDCGNAEPPDPRL